MWRLLCSCLWCVVLTFAAVQAVVLFDATSSSGTCPNSRLQWFVVPLLLSWMEASFGLKSVLKYRTTSAIRGGRPTNTWIWGTSSPEIGELASCIGSSELRQSMSFFTSVPLLMVTSRCLTSRHRQAVICSRCYLTKSGKWGWLLVRLYNN